MNAIREAGPASPGRGVLMHRPGDQPVPGYKLEQFLGSGSYGEVWKVAGPGGVPCALKFIRLDSNSGLKEFRSIGLVKKVRHPNLVPIQGVWLQDPEGNLLGDNETTSVAIRLGGTKTLIIAMGLGDKTLADRLRESPTGIPAAELMRYMEDAARGIDYLNKPVHDLGEGKTPIIHCDIKPANLLLVSDGVQVCDYGVAKALRTGPKKTFGAGGTPAYAPAELLNNDPAPQTDQYSLAVTYFELRTGRLPFDESRAMVANLLGALDLSALPTAGEREVIQRATSPQPAKRFASCREMVEALWMATGLRSQVVKTPDPIRDRPASAPDISFVLPESGSRPDLPTITVNNPPLPPAARLTDRLQVGVELVPGYTLVKLLGQGGYGQVWEAESGGVGYALKVVRDIRGKGKNEFEILRKVARLKHENLVEFRGFWLLAPDGSRVPPDRVGQPGVPAPAAVVIATNLADQNLLQRLRECQEAGSGGVPAQELVGYVQDAAFALDYLNLKHGIQHRDVKPENLLLNDGRVQVSDFGLAKLLDGQGWAVQSANSGMTLEYAAPELLGEKKVSQQTDQYSLALTYYTLRTGLLPYPADAGPRGTMDARLRGELDLSGVTEAERAVLRRALSPRPADRYATCDELARRLADALAPRSPVPPRPAEGIRGTMIPGYDDPPFPSTPSAPTPTPEVVSLKPVAETPSAPPPHREETHGSWTTGKSTAQSRSWGGNGKRTDKVRDTEADVAVVDGPFRDGPVTGRITGRKKNNTAALAAIGIGLGLLTVVGGGLAVYIVSGDGQTQSTGTVATDSRTTKPPEKTTGGEPDPVPAKVAQIEKQIAAKEYDSARLAMAELEKLNKTEAAQLRAIIDREEKADQIRDGFAKAYAAGRKGDAEAKVNELETHLGPDGADEVKEKRKAVAALGKKPEPKSPVPDVPKPPVVTGAEKLDGSIDEVRKLFLQPETVSSGLDRLAVLLPPRGQPNGPTKRVAEALRDAWKKAHAATYQPGKKVSSYLAEFKPPADAEVNQADRDALLGYARLKLGDAIRVGVPKLTAETNWNELREACREAWDGKLDDTTRPWVLACWNECWAELTRKEKSEPSGPRPDLPSGSEGYFGYARNVRRLTETLLDPGKDPKTGAEDIAEFIEGIQAKPAEWATGFRCDRLAELLFRAATSPHYRVSDNKTEADFAKPYQPKDAYRVSGWLDAAQKAAGRAGAKYTGKSGEIEYELTLAEGCRPESERDKNRFRNAAREADAKGYLEKHKPNDKLAQCRFWVFYSMTQEDKTEQLKSRRKAFDFARAPGDERTARYAYNEVALNLRVHTNGGMKEDGLDSKADTLAHIAQVLFENRASWAKWKEVTTEKSPAQEAVKMLVIASVAKATVEKAGRLVVKAANPKGKEADSKPDKALTYAKMAVVIADEKEDLSDASRAEAYGNLGWLQFAAGYNTKLKSEQEEYWKAARRPLSQALELAPSDDKAWHWEFALGTVLRRLAIARATQGKLSHAEQVELANDCAWATNLVRHSEYKAWPVIQAANPDPDDKAIATILYDFEKKPHNEACQIALETAVNNSAFSKEVELPIWRLAALDAKFILMYKAQMPADMKALADRLADKAEEVVPNLKNKDLRTATVEMIARVRKYEGEKRP